MRIVLLAAIPALLAACCCADYSVAADAKRGPEGGEGARVVAIDFNDSDAPAAPSQAMFRIVEGSGDATKNSREYVEHVGSITVRITTASTNGFEFRGANADHARVIPGGQTSVSFLVADFLSARGGVIRIACEGLTAGGYRFHSWHLDTLRDGGAPSQSALPISLGVALHGRAMAEVRPMNLTSSGLGKTSIADGEIPQSDFAFEADGKEPVVFEISAKSEGSALPMTFINGFAIYKAAP